MDLFTTLIIVGMVLAIIAVCSFEFLYKRVGISTAHHIFMAMIWLGLVIVLIAGWVEFMV